MNIADTIEILTAEDEDGWTYTKVITDGGYGIEVRDADGNILGVLE